MNWRTLMGASIGALLPLPMVLLLGGAMRGAFSRPVPEKGPPISPILGLEERLRLRTYHRDCGRTAKCEPPLGCLMDVRYGARYCSDSECMTDEQCPDGHTCRLLATSDGPFVKRCVAIGIRQEGERCVEISDDQEAACAPGLLCGGEDGWCGRPCRMNEPSSCPDGFFCADVPPEPICFPSCEQRGCPEGQQCILHQQGASQCVKTIHGPPCQQVPCPEGRECMVRHASQFPDRVWTECVERCGENRPPCSDGRVCDAWHCLPPCDPVKPDACPDGYRCEQHDARRPWACKPDW